MRRWKASLLARDGSSIAALSFSMSGSYRSHGSVAARGSGGGSPSFSTLKRSEPNELGFLDDDGRAADGGFFGALIGCGAGRYWLNPGFHSG